MRSKLALALLLPCLFRMVAADEPSSPVDPEKLEADGVVIGDIVLDKQNIFDLSNPKENNWIYRLANKYHVITKDRVIRKQLLLEPGDSYSKRLVDETERLLRGNRFLFDAAITPFNRQQDSVDLKVSTRDVWTLWPVFTVSRSGGENKTTIGIEDINLLGRGQTFRFERTEDVDREARTFEFRDDHLGSNWLSGKLFLADNSDGHSRFLSLVRPFYALDTRWSAGASVFDDDRRTAFYELGDEVAEYQHAREQFTAFGGWSSGLRKGWVRRYTTGVVFDENVFTPVVAGTLPALVPTDRKLVYPFFGFELLEDRFEKTTNKNQIARTEDFFTGTHFSATLGWADESLESDRDAIIYSATYAKGFGSLESKALLLRARASGRQESGDTRNAVVRVDARMYWKQSEKRAFFTTVSGIHGHALDADNVIELGGETGLRGYPLRYQTGDSRFLATIEQRYYWDWYPFQLLRVGGAIFADVGRTWGTSPDGSGSNGWLRDVGLGLRLASTRTGGNEKVFHLDLAFPLDGDATIDDVQILLESKRAF